MNVINFFWTEVGGEHLGVLVTHIMEPSMEVIRVIVGHPSSRNLVSTRDVDSTSSLDAWTYFTIVGM